MYTKLILIVLTCTLPILAMEMDRAKDSRAKRLSMLQEKVRKTTADLAQNPLVTGVITVPELHSSEENDIEDTTTQSKNTRLELNES